MSDGVGDAGGPQGGVGEGRSLGTFGYGGVQTQLRQWQDLEPLLMRTSDELLVEEPGGLPPSARPAATAFLDSWSGYAAQSSLLARGFVTALHTVDGWYRGSDRLSGDDLTRLDGRLGRAR